MRFLPFVLANLLAGCAAQTVPEAPAADAPVREVAIVAKQFAFEPAVVTVNKGELVRLNIESVDVTHGISIRQLGIAARLDAGKTTAVEFLADEAGFFEFRCNVFCGSGHSDMLGAIEVLEGTE